MSYDVEILDFEGERSANVVLDFVPFPGLLLMAPWAKNDFYPVHEVFFDSIHGRFSVYLDERGTQ